MDGRQSGQLLSWSLAPAPATICPSCIPMVSRGKWGPGLYTSTGEATQPQIQVALGSGHRGCSQYQQEGRGTFIQLTFVVCLHYCTPCAGPEDAGMRRRPGLRWSEGGRHINKQSQHNVLSTLGAGRRSQGLTEETLRCVLKQRQRISMR